MSSSRIPRSGLLRIGSAGAVVAAAVNAAIYGLGRAAGVAYVVTPTSRVSVVDVVVLSLVWFAIGLVAAAVATRWGGRAVRVLQIVGTVVAVASISTDLTIDGTTSAKATLALMHLVVGAAYVVSLERFLRTVPSDARGVVTDGVGTTVMGRA